jgi:integrase
VRAKPLQFAGGIADGDVCSGAGAHKGNSGNTAHFAVRSSQSVDRATPMVRGGEDFPHCSAPISSNCDSLAREAQQNGEREAQLARRRFQKGCVFRRGKRQLVWVGRWLEDEINPDGTTRRVHRSEVLAALNREDAERLAIPHCPTKRLALRELQFRLDVVNSPCYRARPTATFEQFATRWQNTVLIQHKPSTQATIRGHFGKHLVPFFGKTSMRDIHPDLVQRFVANLKLSPKTVRNIYATFQMVWKSARAWRYVAHDALDGVVRPKQQNRQRRFFTIEEQQRILSAATEPCKTFYWIAAETGMRAGELCGLRVDDLDLESSLVCVCQSAWHGKLQAPKTPNAVRSFALSPQLVEHLRDYLRKWRLNEMRLLFATRNGTPWDANLFLKRKLYPLLDSLGIERGGLHAFRHGNSSLMDRLRVPLKVREQRLGHSDPRLTLGVYTHVVSEDDTKTAEQLGALLSKTPQTAEIPVPNCPMSDEQLVALTQQAFMN